MCGITGIVSLTGEVQRESIDRFTDALAHRGPDGRGTFIDRNIALGHRRLSILDLSEAGTCPMRYISPTGREYTITFNGEVYNFIELREQLQSKGHIFQSRTDTEVIVAAYAEWGESCVGRFNGMWAFAIYDHLSRDIFISRDRFGVKPLYFQRTSQRVAFASELKAFLALPDTKLTFNSAVVQPLWEKFRYDGRSPDTAAREVSSLLGGHNAIIRASGDVVITQWWRPEDHYVVTPQSYDQQVEQFRELFLDAVRLRLRSDVPIATCLSGGIDSSAVATAIHYLKTKGQECGERSASDWQNSFVATFPGTFLDEEHFARRVIEVTGATPHYLPISSESGLKCVVDSIWSMDEPTGGLATSVWMLYRKLREDKIVVSLDGHGGDELLGGYGWYMNMPTEQLNQTLFNDFHRDLLPTILRNYDRSSMAHGIEVRMPLMDYRLVTFAHSLPASSKIGGGYLKRILRDATADFLPPEIKHRQGKIGFNSPLIEWLNGDLVHLLEKVLRHDVFLSLPFTDPRGTADQVLAKCRSKSWVKADWDLAYKVTVMMNISLWRLMFAEGDHRLVENWLPVHSPSTGSPMAEVSKSSQVKKTIHLTNFEIVVVSNTAVISPNTEFLLSKLSEAQVTRPLEFGIRAYFNKATGLSGGVMKNWVGSSDQYAVSDKYRELGIVVDETTVVPTGAKQLFVFEGVSVQSLIPVTRFNSIDQLFTLLEELLMEECKPISSDDVSDKKAPPIDALVSEALRALQGHNIPQARVLIDEAVNLNIPGRDLHFVRGLISLQQGRIEEARSALFAELQIDPGRKEVREILEEVLPLMGSST